MVPDSLLTVVALGSLLEVVWVQEESQKNVEGKAERGGVEELWGPWILSLFQEAESPGNQLH